MVRPRTDTRPVLTYLLLSWRNTGTDEVGTGGEREGVEKWTVRTKGREEGSSLGKTRGTPDAYR